MAKELRIEVSVPLPEGTFDEAEMLTRINPTIKTFTSALLTVGPGSSVTSSVVTLKTPRASKAAEPAQPETPPVLEFISSRKAQEAAVNSEDDATSLNEPSPYQDDAA